MVPALIVLLSVGGYLVTSRTIGRDRDAAAERRAEIESVRAQGLLGRARAFVAGLGDLLEAESVPGQRRFARLVGATAGTVGLVDVFWVQRIRGSERASYERRLRRVITRHTRSGRFERAPDAASYLAVTYTRTTRPELRRGLDVSGWRALAAAVRDRSSVFAVTASRLGSLGNQPGFFLLETARFGRERGYLAVFVPRAWLTLSLAADPRTIAISLEGRRLEGGLQTAAIATGSFEALGRRWRVDVGREPASALQSTLPWLALAWPAAAALLMFLVARAVMRRRRAERKVERIFDLSLDLLCIAGLDGYFKQVNPAFEQTLGYSSRELLSRPLFDFVHPDDRERTRAALGELAHGQELVRFENRYICRDGSERWLEWSTRPVPDEGLVYAAARDVTDRRALADTQDALRRVATLVARGVSSDEVFDAVVREMSRLLGADSTRLLRYEPDGTAIVVATHGEPSTQIPVATRLTLEGENVPALVRRTGRAARMDSFDKASGSLAARLRELGVHTAVGAPVVVDGRLWGVMVAAWAQPGLASPATEARMAQFTELVATALANAHSRAELTASRARVVAAADETRRRIERDLHDGTQQRLVSLSLELRAAEETVPPGLDELRAQLANAASGLAGAAEDLQEISRGIHPAILSRGGLVAALKTLARRSAVPVELEVHAPRRLPEGVEVAAYYVVAEALTNAAKHAQASVVHVDVATDGSVVELAIRDDGVGGADPARGSGLIGLRDRVEALGGTIEIASGSRAGTSLVARIPVDGDAGAGAGEQRQPESALDS